MAKKIVLFFFAYFSTFFNFIRPAALPTTHTSTRSDVVCVICQDTSPVKTTLTCGHMFDTTCLGQWLREKNNCPTCRTRVSSSERETVQSSFTRSQPGLREQQGLRVQAIMLDNEELRTLKNSSLLLVPLNVYSLLFKVYCTRNLVINIRKRNTYKTLQSAAALYSTHHLSKAISLQQSNDLFNAIIKFITRLRINPTSNHTLPLFALTTTALIHLLLRSEKKSKAHTREPRNYKKGKSLKNDEKYILNKIKNGSHYRKLTIPTPLAELETQLRESTI